MTESGARCARACASRRSRSAGNSLGGRCLVSSARRATSAGDMVSARRPSDGLPRPLGLSSAGRPAPLLGLSASLRRDSSRTGPCSSLSRCIDLTFRLAALTRPRRAGISGSAFLSSERRRHSTSARVIAPRPPSVSGRTRAGPARILVGCATAPGQQPTSPRPQTCPDLRFRTCSGAYAGPGGEPAEPPYTGVSRRPAKAAGAKTARAARRFAIAMGPSTVSSSPSRASLSGPSPDARCTSVVRQAR